MICGLRDNTVLLPTILLPGGIRVSAGLSCQGIRGSREDRAGRKLGGQSGSWLVAGREEREGAGREKGGSKEWQNESYGGPLYSGQLTLE